MNETDMKRVQTYLCKLFGSDRITLVAPARPKGSVEFVVGEETLGTVHKDEEDGEISYSVTLTILEEDLPAKVAAAPARGARR